MKRESFCRPTLGWRVSKRSTRLGSAWLALFLAALILSGCGRIQAARPAQTDDMSLTLTMEPTPPITGQGRLVINLADSQGRPVSGAQVTAEGDMTHAGMAPVSGTAEAEAGGRYTVPFQWTMAGDWLLTIDVTLPDGHKTSRQFPVTVGGG